MIRNGEWPVFPSSRNCVQCGQNFSALGRGYKCPACRKPKPKKPPSLELSFREKQIVGLIQQAKTNREIASSLSLTEGTVKEYMHHIFRKLGVRNRTELALWGQANLPTQLKVMEVHQ